MEQEVVGKLSEHGARIGGLETWKQTHETQEHPEIEAKLWNLQTRLPNWAVFLISVLTAALGMLGTLAAIKGG